MTRIILISTLFFVGCTTTYKPNYRKIRPFTYQLQGEEPDAPHIASYDNGDKKLVYVATEHSNEMEGATFKTVQDAFEALKPQIVIVEGPEYKGVESAPELVRSIASCEKSEFKKCGESDYSMYLAHQKRVPFIPGEPPNKMVYKELVKYGYQPKDLVYFHLVRKLPEWNRQKRLSYTAYPLMAKSLIKKTSESFGAELEPDLSDFATWYEEKSGKKLDIKSVEENDVVPLAKKNASFFNLLAYRIGLIREYHILKIISEQLNKYTRIMVVYAAGHHVKSKMVLEEMLGKAEYNKPY